MKKFKKLILIIFILTIFVLPMLSFAQTTDTTTPTTKVCPTGSIQGVLCTVASLISSLIPIIVTLGVVYFIWGVVTYFIGDDEEAKKRGRDRIIYGILGLVVIVAMWGIVTLVIDGLGIDQQELIIGNPAQLATIQNTAKAGSMCYAGPLKSNPMLADVFNYITCLISQSIVPLLFGLATVMFIWGVIQYVINDSDEGKKEKGRNFIIWGIIALTVMVTVWGLVKIIGSTFNINTTYIPQVKQQ